MTNTTRLTALETRSQSLEAKSQSTAATLDRLDARIGKLESAVATQAQEARHQAAQLHRLAETSERVVRLQEQFVAGAASSRENLTRMATQLDSLQSITTDKHAQRLTRLETLAEEHLAKARRAGVEAGGLSAFLVMVVAKVLEFLGLGSS